MAKWKSKSIKYGHSDFICTPSFVKNPSNLSSYQKGIIKRLAELYSGEELDRKLSELRFCSFETAKAIITKKE